MIVLTQRSPRKHRGHKGFLRGEIIYMPVVKKQNKGAKETQRVRRVFRITQNLLFPKSPLINHLYLDF